MNIKHFNFLLIIFVLLILFDSNILYAQNSPQNRGFGETWVATDALGRTLPTYNQAAPPHANKYVGVFYWLWHGHTRTNPIRDVTKILAANPQNPQWQETDYYWGEPEAGYYFSEDPWVTRRNIMMLADAGVDFVFFDYTNDQFDEYATALKTYCGISEELKSQGINVPRIVFFFNSNPAPKIEEIYSTFYKLNKYSDLWFYWEGKPLLLADPNVVLPSKSYTAGLKFKADSSFTGIDVSCPSWGDNIGNMTMKLYKWDSTYASTVASVPVAESTFVNYNDNAWLKLSTTKQPAGEYYYEFSNATQIVGVWGWVVSGDSVTSYLNGVVCDTNWVSRIYYADGTVDPLTNIHNNSAAGHVAIQLPSTIVSDNTEIKNFFTWRQMWAFQTDTTDQWRFLDYHPQTPSYHDGSVEQVCVNKAMGAPLWRTTGIDLQGSSFHPAVNMKVPTYDEFWLSPNTPDGLYFGDQWASALQINPPIITVTGWNEEIAGAWIDTTLYGLYYFMGKLLSPANPYYFVDEFNEEFNRDIEPMKGGYTDDYYYQFVSNVRKYKGVNPQQAATLPETIAMHGNFSDWSTVKPVYYDAAGDVAHRNYPNVDSSAIYVNDTGRNDIIESRVAYDSSNIYFYVKTNSALTPYTDKNWMLLFIDSDTNHATGWEGYDYLINLNIKSDSVTTLARWNGQDSSWDETANLRYQYTGNQMQIAVPRNLINQTGNDISFYFHWADNIQKLNDITEFFIDGDSAPDRRFNYWYTTQTPTGVKETYQLPQSFSLSQNYPNPFNPSTQIKYGIPKSGIVTLKVYNMLGQEVATLVNQEQKSGNYIVNFDASKLASGVYLYRIEANGFSLTKKMTLLK
ncbi:MAG: T9SS type A sorting domain-containing protein [Ignavibacteriaceae bacterium]